MSYEPFGKRRNVVGAADPNGEIIGTSTDRGYTNHEHLDELGLIHMNGRVYDPSISRFTSADPNIPNSLNIQSYNRYSYTRNNPLMFVDPTGYFDIAAWLSDVWGSVTSIFGVGPGGAGHSSPPPPASPQVTDEEVQQVIITGTREVRPALTPPVGCAANGSCFSGTVNIATPTAEVPSPRSPSQPRPRGVKFGGRVGLILNLVGLLNATIDTNKSDPSAPPQPGEIPTSDWNDPTKPPVGPNGEEWVWHGKPPQGGDKGAYVNPSNPDQSAHPDLTHPPPVRPHWDSNDRNKDNSGWRIYPDGKIDGK